jgi:AcrR family transcriptional regulator
MSDDSFIMLGADGDLPQRADALANRAEILQAARRLFTEQGIENVSMTAVGQAAGVGKGTLYRHFRNKADLSLALLDSDQAALQTKTIQHLRDSDDPPVELLDWFLGELCDFTRRNLGLLCASTLERIEGEMVDFDHPAHRWQRLTILGLLRRIKVEGDLEYLADAIYALVDPRLYRFQHITHEYSHERILAGVRDVAHRLIG